MKKILILALLLVGCNTDKKDVSPKTSVTPTTVTPTSTAPTTVVKTDTTTISGEGNTTIDGVSKSNPDSNIETVDIINLNKDTGLIIRFSMPAAITSDEVQSAYVRLKYKSGDEPSFKATGVTEKWQRTDATWNNIHKSNLLDNEILSKKDDNDFYSVDVTDIVKKYLDGTNYNYGFLITSDAENISTTFYSPYNCSDGEYPELVVEYVKKPMPPVGVYTYIPQEKGNCFSFALRDTTPILDTNLNYDLKVVEEKYNSIGIESVLEYINQVNSDYVEKHKEGLKIESIRKIDSFDSEINDGEYRIAFRVGVLTLEDKFNELDFHYQVQLIDGSWAEKAGASESRIVPGSNLNNDPSLYPWDASAFWDSPQTNGLYDSNTIFYAVKKSTLEFTSHSN